MSTGSSNRQFSTSRADFSFQEGRICWIRFGHDNIVVTEEMEGWHPAPLLSKTDWARKLNTVAFAPITGMVNKYGYTKLLFRSVPILNNIAGQTKDGLILITQLDTMRQSEFNHRHLNQTTDTLPVELLSKARAKVRGVLAFENEPRHNRYEVYPFSLAVGDIVRLREKGTDSPDAWVIVNSDIYLELLQASAQNSRNLRGLVRGVISVVPLFSIPSKPGEITVPIERSQPGLLNGGHCRFHHLRNRSIQRIEKVLGPMDDNYFNDIIFGLHTFLGSNNQ